MKYWYYVQNDKQCGPIPEQELVDLITAGKLNPRVFVWTQGLSEWIRACEIDNLIPSPPPLPTSKAASITAQEKDLDNNIEEVSEDRFLGRAVRVVSFISIVIVGFLLISGLIGISKDIFGSEDIVALFYPLLGKNATVFLAGIIGILRYGLPFYIYFRIIKYCRNKLVPMK